MSVYTELSQADIEQLLSLYSLGQYRSHKGISAGVENTNYFVSTDDHELVLTLFEKHSLSELPFYLQLGEHLHTHQCKVPQPFRCNSGEFLQIIKDKPAVFIERASGGHVDVNVAYAVDIAQALGEIHNATQLFTETQPHTHGLAWVQEHAGRISPQLEADEQSLLNRVLTLLEKIPNNLPSGIIHADLFHDNALFDNGHITAIIDWYFAGHDSFALDVAITLNDWCITPSGVIDLARVETFVDAYQQTRTLSELELDALPLLQVQSATRFWLSRIIAKQQHLESDDNITVKDPNEMKQILTQLMNYTDV